MRNDYKKTVNIEEYTISVCPDGSIEVLIDGKPFHGNVKGMLRDEIAPMVHFDVDPRWNTQQLGSKLVDYINKEHEIIERGAEQGIRMVARTIYLISCSKKKATKDETIRLPAEQLYTGPLFKLSLEYAKQQKSDDILILSARHHVVRLDKLLNPYDQFLGGEKMTAKDRKEWAYEVLTMLEKMGYNLKKDNFVFLTGRKYYENLLNYMPNAEVAGDPRGIGYKLQWFKEHIMEQEEECFDCVSSKRQSKRESVKKLRYSMAVVDNCPGYYIWWFHKSCVKKLLEPLDSLIGVRWNDIIFDEKGYAALYIGITKRGLRERFSDHIKGNRGSSTLRLTLCALFGIQKAQSEDAIDDFMDHYCEWEWICTDAEEAESVENDELSTNYYPLNIDGNTSFSPSDKRKFQNFRNQYKNID